jgi:hypothetical protein
MVCEDDENNSEPEMVSHEDVQPEVAAQKPEAVPAKPERLADDLSKVRLADTPEKADKKTAEAAASGDAAVATSGVTSPKPSHASAEAADDDDDRPQPPDDDSVPDEDSLVTENLLFPRTFRYRKYIGRAMGFSLLEHPKICQTTLHFIITYPST